ncbi:hypothetical protein N7495_004555 [Penicillium taxi]|uniref:uncharacterized protein n=1 Tax=Penicillium taxi TaxID=168475 RepID=UPI002545A50F|nr:uncharacterized protein N7495_004555 [Penicillium taxi]KAJ5899811.1 hypothetical protein N7495_004555 [Penicillium taxi]
MNAVQSTPAKCSSQGKLANVFPHPSEQYLSEHNYETCRDILKDERSFRRKGHLMQHLRHAHHMHTLPLIDGWHV